MHLPVHGDVIQESTDNNAFNQTCMKEDSVVALLPSLCREVAQKPYVVLIKLNNSSLPFNAISHILASCKGVQAQETNPVQHMKQESWKQAHRYHHP